jgi:hypothetical protein
VGHMHVDSRFFPREEEQPELTIAYDCGRHKRNVAEAVEGASARELSSGRTCLKPGVRLI